MNLVARRWTKGNKKPAISNGFFTFLDFLGLCYGGDEGDRTPGLGIANAALSQLSYIPFYAVLYGAFLPPHHDLRISIYDFYLLCQVIAVGDFFILDKVPPFSYTHAK